MRYMGWVRWQEIILLTAHRSRGVGIVTQRIALQGWIIVEYCILISGLNMASEISYMKCMYNYF